MLLLIQNETVYLWSVSMKIQLIYLKNTSVFTIDLQMLFLL